MTMNSTRWIVSHGTTTTRTRLTARFSSKPNFAELMGITEKERKGREEGQKGGRIDIGGLNQIKFHALEFIASYDINNGNNNNNTTSTARCYPKAIMQSGRCLFEQGRRRRRTNEGLSGGGSISDVSTKSSSTCWLCPTLPPPPPAPQRPRPPQRAGIMAGILNGMCLSNVTANRPLHW